MAVLLLLQQEPFLLQGLYDSRCALLEDRQACASQHTGSVALSCALCWVPISQMSKSGHNHMVQSWISLGQDCAALDLAGCIGKGLAMRTFKLPGFLSEHASVVHWSHDGKVVLQPNLATMYRLDTLAIKPQRYLQF